MTVPKTCRERAAEKGLAGMIVTPGEGSGLAHRIPTNGDY
jgi:hypothetical protein